MAIQLASTDAPEIDDDSFVEDSDKDSYTFRQLLDLLILHKEIILTIPADQEDLLRRGLAIRKSKDNAKLKRAGLVPDTEALSFLVYPVQDENGNESADAINIRIKLGQRKSVKVLNVTLPDPNAF